MRAASCSYAVRVCPCEVLDQLSLFQTSQPPPMVPLKFIFILGRRVVSLSVNTGYHLTTNIAFD